MIIDVDNANQALEYKSQVIAAGLLQGVDFYWKFTPRQDDWIMNEYINATVEFSFKDKTMETYFQLKWAK